MSKDNRSCPLNPEPNQPEVICLIGRLSSLCKTMQRLHTTGLTDIRIFLCILTNWIWLFLIVLVIQDKEFKLSVFQDYFSFFYVWKLRVFLIGHYECYERPLLLSKEVLSDYVLGITVLTYFDNITIINLLWLKFFIVLTISIVANPTHIQLLRGSSMMGRQIYHLAISQLPWPPFSSLAMPSRSGFHIISGRQLQLQPSFWAELSHPKISRSPTTILIFKTLMNYLLIFYKLTHDLTWFYEYSVCKWYKGFYFVS